MKKISLIWLIASLLVLSACNRNNDDKGSPTGKKILKSLVGYQICENTISHAKDDAKKKNEKVEGLKKNPNLAKEISELDKACTEPERKNQFERASCAEKACTALSQKTDDIRKYVDEKCPDNVKVPSWSKLCREAYAKVARSIKEASTL